MMNNFGFHRSKIENEIYDVIEPFEVGVDVYEEEVVGAITDFFYNNYSHIKYTYWCGSAGFCMAFVDDGYPHMITFDIYQGEEEND